MSVKELRQGLRARGFVVPFVLVHIACIIALVGDYVTSGLGSGGSQQGIMGDPGQAVWFLSSIAMLAVMPLAALGGLTSEMDGRNFELLLLAGLSRWRIALGKWLTHVALSMLLLVSVVPYLLLLYFFGGVDLGKTLLMVVGLAGGNAAALGLALGVSGYQHFFGKAALLVVAGGSFMIVMGTATGVMFEAGTQSLWKGIFAICSILFVSGLYAVLGMQLIRARLRAYENPIDPPPTGLIAGILVTLPMILGILTVSLPIWGTLVGGGFFLVLSVLIDPEKVRAGG